MQESTNNKLTDENIKQIEDVMEEVKSNSEELSTIAELPSNNGKEERSADEVEDGEAVSKIITVDPNTGEHKVVGDVEITDSGESKSVEEIFDMDINTDIDIDNSPITKEEFNDAVKDSLDGGTLSEFGDIELSEHSTLMLMDLVNKKMADPNMSVKYIDYPKELQSMIDKAVSALQIPALSTQGRTMRNTYAEMIIDEFISNTQTKRIQEDFNSEIESIFEKGGNEIANAVVGYTQDRNRQYREYAEGLDDEDKKNKILTILDTIDEAYNLTELKEFAKKCKIKKIELEKPDRVYSIIMQKYQNSNYNIYDINMARPILYRNLNEGELDFIYNEKDITAFFIAFSKQCMNKRSEVVTDHAYMYYVLYNIVLMDINKGKEQDVSTVFKNNVIEVIENLRVRNNNYK